MNDVFARAEHESEEACNGQDRYRPLHFRAVIAEPEKRERNNHRGSDRAEREPSQFPLMRKPVATFRYPVHLRGNGKEIRDREDAIASTRDACATQSQSILL